MHAGIRGDRELDVGPDALLLLLLLRSHYAGVRGVVHRWVRACKESMSREWMIVKKNLLPDEPHN